jgi:predicted esterase
MLFLRMRSIFVVTLAVLVARFVAPATAAQVTMKSGAKYEGIAVRVSSVTEDPQAPSVNLERKPIVVIDDELRFVYVPYHQTNGYLETPPKKFERIKIQQNVASAGRKLGSVGDYLSITDFDEWGRRHYAMPGGPTGQLDVYQGITEITPTYTKIEGLGGVRSPIVWDMRVATTSIPYVILRKVLMHAKGADPKNADSRLRIITLFIQGEMYREALTELVAVLNEFPDLEHLKEQRLKLVQMLAQQVLRDIELRRSAGQHQRAQALLGHFPDKDVDGETLLRVRDRLKDYDHKTKQIEHTIQLLDQQLGEFKDETLKAKLSPIVTEIKNELNFNTLDRMADYLRLGDDEKLPIDQRISLAISGWLLGNGAGIENLSLALSLLEARELIVKYIQSDLVHEREQYRDKIKTLEGGSPSYVSQIIAQMRPPRVSETAEPTVPGLYEFKIPGIEDQPEFTYTVQLPPEYDADRRYPCIVTLCGNGSTDLQQIAWWAGDYSEKVSMRTGQATRRGYIVISPRWQRPLQNEFEYSVREHAAVLYTLRDACQRMSIDTDRVFLSGHFSGGDAAWDIALAHPDLWAGCILFAPHADRYVKFYHENARHVPLYIICGEKDGGTSADGNWVTENASELDRYLEDGRTDCTLVLYRGRGRGREGFSDEIHHIFEWMELPSRRRNFAPTKMEVVSMRPWDNFFWWLEAEEFPTTTMVLPHAWTPNGTPGSVRPAKIEAEYIAKTGRIIVNTSCDRVTVWLSPDLVSFDRPIEVAVLGRELREEIKPSIDVILEDVRTRGDRQHPFWAQIEWPERKKR